MVFSTHLSTPPTEDFGPFKPLQQTLPKVWGLVREVARDGEGVTWDGTWTEGTGPHVDGGDGTVRGRRRRDAHTNLAKQHPPWVQIAMKANHFFAGLQTK